MESLPGDNSEPPSLPSLNHSSVLDIEVPSEGHQRPMDSYSLPDLEILNIPPEDPPTECRICESKLESESVSPPGCSHVYCVDCVTEFMRERLSRKEVEDQFPCPAFQCTAKIPDDIVRRLLTPVEIEKLERFRIEKALEADPAFRWCPQPGCKGFSTIQDLQAPLTCNVCGMLYCGYCHSLWHPGEECPEGKDRQFDEWLRGAKAKFCPRCKMRVEKNEGCMHMTCVQCRYEWCWRCGEDFHNHENCIAVVKRHWADVPLEGCLLILFLIFIFPFSFVIVGFQATGREMLFRRIRSTCGKIVAAVFIILFWLIASPLCFAIAGMMLGHIALFEGYSRCIRRRHCCIKMTVSLLYLLGGLLVTPFLILAVLCFLSISPILGMVMLTLNCYFRQQHPPSLKSKVPGYPVS